MNTGLWHNMLTANYFSEVSQNSLLFLQNFFYFNWSLLACIYVYKHIVLVKKNKIPKIGWEFYCRHSHFAAQEQRTAPFWSYLYVVTMRWMRTRAAVNVIISKGTSSNHLWPWQWRQCRQCFTEFHCHLGFAHFDANRLSGWSDFSLRPKWEKINDL